MKIKCEASRMYHEASLEKMMRIYEQSERSLEGIRRMIERTVEMIDEYDSSNRHIVVKSTSNDHEDCDSKNRIDNAIEYMRSIARTNQNNIWKDTERLSFAHDEVVATLPAQHLESFVSKPKEVDVSLTSSLNSNPKPLYYNKVDYAVEDWCAWKWSK